MNDYIKFQEFMAGLGEIFDRKLSKVVLDMYWKSLEPYSDEQCIDAFNEAFIAFKFFPKPVELIETITGGVGQLEDVAEIQVSLVINTIKKYGVYNSIQLEDPVTISVIQQCYGGWIMLCSELKTLEEKWFRKDFVRYYKAYKRQNILSHEKLPGLIEFENSDKHIEHIPEPVMIVSPDKAKMIE